MASELGSADRVQEAVDGLANRTLDPPGLPSAS